jgi:hypothetical protein
VTLGHASTEPGSNQGSDFFISRANDAGTLIDSPIIIKRTDGRVSLNGDPTLALHAATKNYVDNQVALKVAKTGDTIAGNLAITGTASNTLTVNYPGGGVGFGLVLQPAANSRRADLSDQRRRGVDCICATQQTSLQHLVRRAAEGRPEIIRRRPHHRRHQCLQLHLEGPRPIR